MKTKLLLILLGVVVLTGIAATFRSSDNQNLFVGSIESSKSFRQWQGVLTPVDAGVTLDFDATTTLNSITLTGNVTFAFSNLATNRTYRLRVINPTSTNCTITFPAGSVTNFFGGMPSIITAGKRATWSMESWGTTDADVDNSWVETQ